MPFTVITRRTAIKALAAVATLSATSGTGFGSRSSRLLSKVTPTPQPVPAGPITTGSVTVTAVNAGSIDPLFTGLSYEKTQLNHKLFHPTNKDLIALLKLLGPGLLRIGGDSSDKIVWTPKGAGGVYKEVTPSEVSALAAFVKATAWKCLYTVNLGGSANGTTSPALAAAEVAFAAQQFGASLYGIEIGNEPDAYVKPGRQYDGKEWTLATYEAVWNEYRSAILAAVPNVVITGPAAGHLATWTIPFTEHQTKTKLSLLTDHYYRGSGSSGSASLEKLITQDTLLQSNLKLMREAQARTGIPFRLGETNSYTGGKLPGISDTYASTLWSLDFMFNCALGGSTGVNFHGGKTTSYTPLADNTEKVIAVMPEFYGILFFTLADGGTLQATQVSAEGLNVSAYAVKSSAATSVVIVNRERAQNLKLVLQMPQPVRSASLLQMTQLSPGAVAPELGATSGVSIQGATIGTDGRFSPGPVFALNPSGQSLTCYVPALSAVLVRIS